MDNSASRVESGEIRCPTPTSPPPSKLKTYGFAIAIIMGIGGLAVGAAGLAGYFQVGALSNMSQIDAIIIMAAGSGGGIILLIIGVVGTVTNRQSSSHQRDVHVDTERRGATHKSGSTGRAEIIRSDKQDESVYGPAAWMKIWNVEVLDAVPPMPRVDLSKKDKVLLYIPQKIRFDGKERVFYLKTLKEISGVPSCYFSESVERQFGDNTAPGWVLIDKNVIPESRNKDYVTQKRMVEERGCSMPNVLEAVVLNLMVFAHTGERLYGQEPCWTYTRCIQKIDGQHPVVVGFFGSNGLIVRNDVFDDDCCGVACAQRKF